MIDDLTQDHMEQFIQQIFEENYEAMRAEEGRALGPHVIQSALLQVLLYWRKMRHVAERVTDTEVQLSLPNQISPNGRHFTIQGVVDIVRDNEQTVMYDIKTHDVDYVRTNRESYAQQLNVYAHIWQELRQQPLDGCAIIATDYPSTVRRALDSADPEHIAWAMQRWNPLVTLDFNTDRVHATIEFFGEVVDAIENGEFSPPEVETLRDRVQGNETFATRVCRNCDARYSCRAYRIYVAQDEPRQASHNFPFFYDTEEQENWRTASLDAATNGDDLLLDLFDANTREE